MLRHSTFFLFITKDVFNNFIVFFFSFLFTRFHSLRSGILNRCDLFLDFIKDIGVTDALNLLYDTYVKAVHYIRDCNYMDDYQKEMLMQKYNLEEAMEVLGGNDFDR